MLKLLNTIKLSASYKLSILQDYSFSNNSKKYCKKWLGHIVIRSLIHHLKIKKSYLSPKYVFQLIIAVRGHLSFSLYPLTSKHSHYSQAKLKLDFPFKVVRL